MKRNSARVKRHASAGTQDEIPVMLRLGVLLYQEDRSLVFWMSATCFLKKSKSYVTFNGWLFVAYSARQATAARRNSNDDCQTLRPDWLLQSKWRRANAPAP